MQCSVINIFWPLYTTFDGYILLSVAIYYFRQLYTTFGGHVLLSTTFGGYILLLTAIQYFRRLNTTFSFTFCNFETIQYFPAICGLKTGLEFNINLLALIQFWFFCSSMASSINFNSLFWKCCFIRNTQMLKMWHFLHFALQMVCMVYIICIMVYIYIYIIYIYIYIYIIY